MDKFIARENVRHLRSELENGANEPRRATMLRLLVEEENRLGLTRNQLSELDHHISRLAEIIAMQTELTDNLIMLGHPTEKAETIRAMLNDLMACYIAHRERIRVALKYVPASVSAWPRRGCAD